MNYNSLFQTEQLKTFKQVYLLFRLILNMKNRLLINHRNFLYFLRIRSKITFCMALRIMLCKKALAGPDKFNAILKRFAAKYSAAKSVIMRLTRKDLNPSYENEQ